MKVNFNLKLRLGQSVLKGTRSSDEMKAGRTSIILWFTLVLKCYPLTSVKTEGVMRNKT